MPSTKNKLFLLRDVSDYEKHKTALKPLKPYEEVSFPCVAVVIDYGCLGPDNTESTLVLFSDSSNDAEHIGEDILELFGMIEIEMKSE